MSAQKQSFRGLITITTGTNDTIDWQEDDSGTPKNLSKVLTISGAQWPADIATQIGTDMTTQSAATGDTITYTAAIDNDTGITTITASAGTFRLEVTASESQKLLTGGDQTAGSRGANHFGWNVDSGYPTAALTQVGDAAHANAWYPTAPDSGPTMRDDDLGNLSSFAIESRSLGGTVKSYDFGDSTRGSRNLEERALSFEYLTAASRTQYEEEFWLVYAKQGSPDGRFRFFVDRSTATSVVYHLTGDSLTSATFQRTTAGISRWSLDLSIKRYKA